MTWCEMLDAIRNEEALRIVISFFSGVGMSYVLEYWPKFETWEPRWKRLFVLGLCLALPLAALMLAWGTRCIEVPGGEEFWQAVQVGGVVFLSSQFAHTRKLE